MIHSEMMADVTNVVTKVVTTLRWIRCEMMRTSIRRGNSEQLLRVAAQRRWEVSQDSGTNAPTFALPIWL